MNVVYIVCEHDDHGDPVYYAFYALEDALIKARQLSDWVVNHYEGMDMYKTEFDEEGPCLFCEYGEERWQVSINSVEVK